MKKLELNQMEIVEGGGGPTRIELCRAEMGIGALTGSVLGGPAGFFIGAALGYIGGAHCGII